MTPPPPPSSWVSDLKSLFLTLTPTFFKILIKSPKHKIIVSSRDTKSLMVSLFWVDGRTLETLKGPKLK